MVQQFKNKTHLLISSSLPPRASKDPDLRIKQREGAGAFLLGNTLALASFDARIGVAIQ
jgi:hypothetical protein